MYKKFLLTLIFLFSAFLFSSCWIYPDAEDYKIDGNVYYFKDYNTMKSIIIPEINKSFTNWHWSSQEFDEKYDKYFGNIDINTKDYSALSKSEFNYAVRNGNSSSQIKTKGDKDIIISEYFWITTKDKGSVIFYQN